MSILKIFNPVQIRIHLIGYKSTERKKAKKLKDDIVSKVVGNVLSRLEKKKEEEHVREEDTKIPVFSNTNSIEGSTTLDFGHNSKRFFGKSVVISLVGEIQIGQKKLQFLKISKDHKIEEFSSHNNSNDFIYKFEFSLPGFTKDGYCYNTFSGKNCDVLYYIRVKVEDSSSKDFKLIIRNFSEKKKKSREYSKEVQLKEYFRIHVFLESKILNIKKDTVCGYIKLLKFNINIKKMNLMIVRKEILLKDFGKNDKKDFCWNKKIGDHEIMDYACEKDTKIPFRMFIKHLKRLTPTYKNINKCFRVRYFLHIQVVSVTNKRFYKNIPIILFQT